jgi:hypothetical protein
MNELERKCPSIFTIFKFLSVSSHLLQRRYRTISFIGLSIKLDSSRALTITQKILEVQKSK